MTFIKKLFRVPAELHSADAYFDRGIAYARKQKYDLAIADFDARYRH